MSSGCLADFDGSDYTVLSSHDYLTCLVTQVDLMGCWADGLLVA